MIIAPRWRKLFGDFTAARGRIGLMILALAMGLFALATIASAYAILGREISRNYLATNPASATIDVGAVTPQVLRAIAAEPDIESAEAVSIVEAQAKGADGTWHRTLLFVLPDLEHSRVSQVLPGRGQFPPPDGTVLLEREALRFLDLKLGNPVSIALPGSGPVAVPIAGTVHDPSLAPSWQEQTAYAYMSPQTYAALGGNPALELVKVIVRGATFDQARVDSVIGKLALSLRQQGYAIHQVQVPPTGLHPHQGQMTGVLSMFLMFAGLALILSAVLTATMVSGLLAQQIRQIAIMKAIGGTTRQVAALYFAGLALVAAIATAVALPLGLWAASGFANVIAELLNFDLASASPPLWLVATLALIGVLLPLAFVAIPIRRATRATVREALADQGLAADAARTDVIQRLLGRFSGLDRTLLLALRNAFRKRGRLVLNLALLGAAGAMFFAALDVEAAWRGQLDKASALRDYDVEIKLTKPVAMPALAFALAGVPGIATIHPADFEAAAVGRGDGLMIVRTYPDGGHGSLSLRPDSEMPFRPEYLQGGNGGGNAVVNQQAWTLLGRPVIGSDILLAVASGTRKFALGGVIRQILTPASAYVSPAEFADFTGRHDATAALRLVATSRRAADREIVATAAQAALAQRGIAVEQVVTEAALVAAQAGHVKILTVALMAMAVIMAGVGAVGLASSQGSSVTERLREFGIMRTIGASGGALTRNILAEGLMIALLSLPLAVVAGLPLGYGVGVLVGTLSFGLALPLTFSMPALGIWLALLVTGSLVASYAPARRAARLTIRQTLSQN